jgi:hypothetical protein
MSKRSNYRGTGAHRPQKKARPLVATAAAVSGAGLLLAGPAAALLANPGEAHAAPGTPAPQQPITSLFGCVLGSANPAENCDAGDNVASARGLGNGLALANLDPFLDIAGGIPILNIFVGNGADGTALHPNGYNGGFFIGSGGDGLSATTAGTNGGTGGKAGLIFGKGGAGGNGANGDATHVGGNGGNGGAGAMFIGNGGSGGSGGAGAPGVNPTTSSTAGVDPMTGNGLDGVGLQNGGNGLSGLGGSGGKGGDLGGNGGT